MGGQGRGDGGMGEEDGDRNRDRHSGSSGSVVRALKKATLNQLCSQGNIAKQWKAEQEPRNEGSSEAHSMTTLHIQAVL